MQFAGAVEDSLVDRGVMLDAHAGVLRGELVNRIGEALLIAPPLGLDGDAEHGGREGDGLQVKLVLVVGIVQYGIEVQLLHFGDGTDVARYRLGNLHGVLAEERI
jgi:hypothetical protein